MLLVMGMVLALATSPEPSKPATPPPAPPKRPTMVPYTRPPFGQSGTIQILTPDPIDQPQLTQNPSRPLDPRQVVVWQTARRLRNGGQLEAARDTLKKALETPPRHPILLDELARVLGAMNDWSGVEKLARAERAAQKDTVLLGHELAMALERQKKYKDATAVVIEVWGVKPTDSDWAVETLDRLSKNDSRGVRELVHKAAAARPDRVDFLSAAAALDWKMGEGQAALKSLAASDRPGLTPPLRWRFADVLLSTQAARDSAGAIEALVSMAADVRFDPSYRMLAGRRAMEIHRARGTGREGAPAVYKALQDLSPGAWNAELLVDVARGLREAGQTADARKLLDAPQLAGPGANGVTLERAMTELRDGPSDAVLQRFHDIAPTSPEARFRFAEALFFAGKSDSALAEYKRVSKDPAGPYSGAAFERMYLIEDISPKSLQTEIGRLMFLDWSGDNRQTLALADTIYHSLTHGPLWARIAIFRGQRLDASGQSEAALVPLLELANGLPDDRLAPLARQMAGDIYLYKLKKEPEAIAQYEECLTRYPRSWNSAEVRRRLESLRKSRF